MKIILETVRHVDQRYETWGDWYYDPDGTLHIKVSADIPELPTEDHHFLIALHELVEVWLCKKRGITAEQVDAHDFQFESEGHPADAEPGDDPRAPYRNEHRFAMLIEHLMARELGLVGYGTVK